MEDQGKTPKQILDIEKNLLIGWILFIVALLILASI